MKNIIGKRFGKLTVICDDPNNSDHVIVRCDCGNEKSMRRWNLTAPTRPSRSCGCEQKRSCLENAKSHNAKNRSYNTNLEVIKTDKPYSNNKSGYKGVCWDKQRKKWYASICVHRKRIMIGRFDNIEDAVRARQEAVERLHNPIIEQMESDNFE